MKTLTAGLSCWGMILLLSADRLHAEEKNGVQLTVQKKTLDRADVRTGYYYADRIDRTQGLKVTVRNMSIKPQPEGEVIWTIIVRPYSSTILNAFTGSEPLKALRPADTVDMVMGAAQITGWRDWYDSAKDKMEYQVIVKQGGAETVRVQSTSGFDALAKRASIKKVASAPTEGPDLGEAQPATTTTRRAATPAPRPAATPAPIPRATPTPRIAPAPRATPAPRPSPVAADDAPPLDGGALPPPSR